jgi:hypothetical protein
LCGRFSGGCFVSVAITALGPASLSLASGPSHHLSVFVTQWRDRPVSGEYELNFLFRHRNALGKVFLARSPALI